MRDPIIIGARGSKLSLWQANLVAAKLEKITSARVEVKKIKTTGDKILDSPLAKIGDKGLFVKEIEVALSVSEIDLAVHSAKDLPTETPSDLTIAAILKRDDHHDALISREKLTLNDLPQNATIGTSSLRRKAQLLNFRQDFKFADLRGNVETRIRKMNEGQFDAIILSAAGLDRLGLSEIITERISTDICLSAVGQGTIAVEARKDDSEMFELLKHLDHEPTRVAVLAERSLLRRLEGGCQVPIGAHGEIEGGELELEAIVASLDGKDLIRGTIFGDPSDPEATGLALAQKLLDKGAGAILAEIRSMA